MTWVAHRTEEDVMTEFDFMKRLADLVAEALTNQEITDGRDRNDLLIRYRAESRITAVGEDTATVKVTLIADSYGYKDRTFTVRVDEGD